MEYNLERKKRWDDISSIDGGRRTIDRRANYIIHIDNGTMRYSYKFDDHIEAIVAEYKDFGAESGREAMLCAYPDVVDAKAVWNKLVELRRINQEDYWN